MNPNNQRSRMKKNFTGSFKLKIPGNILILILLAVLRIHAQVSICEQLLFEDGKTGLTKKMEKQLNNLCQKSLKFREARICLTCYRDTLEEKKYGKKVAEERMKMVSGYLISKNKGQMIREICIVEENNDSVIFEGDPEKSHRFECRIKDRFPDIYKEDLSWLYFLAKLKIFDDAREADTILRGPEGTLVKIKGGSFKPYRIKDFSFEVVEFFTTGSVFNHNMSTFTTSGKLINRFKAIGLWASPLDHNIPFPDKLLIPAIVLIPRDSLAGDDEIKGMKVFRCSPGSRSYITWRSSDPIVESEVYGGSAYCMIKIPTLGLFAIGCVTQPEHFLEIAMPRFRQFTIRVFSERDNSLLILKEGTLHQLRVPCVISSSGNELSYQIIAEVVDRSGNVYQLEQPLKRFAHKRKNHYFVIRKKDFIKL